MKSEMPRIRHPDTQRGFTLVELVVAIVALAALGAGLAVVFVEGVASSADPQIRAQARAIADGYVEEIMLKRYCENPDDSTPCSDETGSDEGETRATYDDICDYNAIGTEEPTDQNGEPSGGPDEPLADYEVTVAVGDGTNDCGSDEGPQRIEVTVSHSSGRVSYELVSQRAEY